MLSPFTPLFFPNLKVDGVESNYMQTFAPTDRILIEILHGGDYDATDAIYCEPDHEKLFDIQYRNWEYNSPYGLKFAEISLNPGIYTAEINGNQSAPFQVTNDDTVLANTTLIQYSMDSNKHRQDAMFFIDGMQRFFDFRVPGGFKDANWTFSVECEQFVNDQSDIIQLYALESTQHKFTLGTSEGCPIWFAEMLNRLLCCTYVYFDGVRYARKDTAVPEVSQQLESVNSFVCTQNLQKIVNIDPAISLSHEAILRRVDTSVYRTISDNVNRLIY